MAKRKSKDRRLPAKLYFKIGEVSDLTDLAPSVLRYWETEFGTFLRPEKTRSGHRLYKRKDVELVARLRELLYEERFTIAGARRLLETEARDGTARRVDKLRSAAERQEIRTRKEMEDVIAALRKGVRELRAVADEDARADPSMPYEVETRSAPAKRRDGAPKRS